MSRWLPLAPSRREHTVDVDCPDCSDMAIVCAQSFSIVRIPDIHDVVLRGREQQIAVCIEDDLGQRPFVSL